MYDLLFTPSVPHNLNPYIPVTKRGTFFQFCFENSRVKYISLYDLQLHAEGKFIKDVKKRNVVGKFSKVQKTFTEFCLFSCKISYAFYERCLCCFSLKFISILYFILVHNKSCGGKISNLWLNLHQVWPEF